MDHRCGLYGRDAVLPDRHLCGASAQLAGLDPRSGSDLYVDGSCAALVGAARRHAGDTRLGRAMILSRILDMLARQQTATLDEIARAVGSPPPAVRSMLETLQRKGLVHRLE